MANIARDGAPKRVTTPEVHNGMSHMTRDGQRVVGQTDHAAVASGGLMTSSLPGKRHTMAVAAGNDRHRGTDAHGGSAVGENIRASTRQIDHILSAKILDQAYAAGTYADQMTRRVFVPTKK